ncbi:unnamed protein product [Orchesella dallaii]|uniref:Uncharacterized protein n=1 Tax=Orchesella dallaii TaxID=48710 RepID=A0ABP1PZP5_9HEXA
MKYQRRASIFAKIDLFFSIAHIVLWNKGGMMGFFLIVIQSFSALHLAIAVEKKEIDECKCWMTFTIFISITYVNSEFPHLSCTLLHPDFTSFGCVFIAVFTVFKVFELAVVYEFIEEVKRYGTPITSVAAGTSQSQVVLPYVVATNLNTSTANPSGAPQSQIVLPNVVVTDLAPACPETQNQPSSVNILTPDLPPSYSQTRLQGGDESAELPPPSYDEVISSK